MKDEKTPDTIEVTSGDIIRSGPIERGVSDSTDAERAELYKHMAFEADKEVKRLQADLEKVRDYGMKWKRRVGEIAALARKADDELAQAQRGLSIQTISHDTLAARSIGNARAALTKALEGWE